MRYSCPRVRNSVASSDRRGIDSRPVELGARLGQNMSHRNCSGETALFKPHQWAGRLTRSADSDREFGSLHSKDACSYCNSSHGPANASSCPSTGQVRSRESSELNSLLAGGWTSRWTCRLSQLQLRSLSRCLSVAGVDHRQFESDRLRDREYQIT